MAWRAKRFGAPPAPGNRAARGASGTGRGRIRRKPMIRSAIVLLALATAIGSCTAPPPGAPPGARANGGQCFIASQVNSFTATRDGNVDVKVGAGRYYRLTLGGGCPQVDWSTSVGIRAIGGGNFICEGYDAELIVPDPSGTQRCPVSGVHAISKEQY